MQEEKGQQIKSKETKIQPERQQERRKPRRWDPTKTKVAVKSG